MTKVICKYCEGIGQLKNIQEHPPCPKCNGHGHFYTYEEKVSKPTRHGYSNKPSGSYTKDQRFD